MTPQPRVMHIKPLYHDRCCVAPSPEVAASMAEAARQLEEQPLAGGLSVRLMLARPEGRHLPRGFNDGVIYPPERIAALSGELRLSPESARLAQRLAPTPPQGELRLIVLLVDFDDNRFRDADALRTNLQAMLFSQNVFATGSLNDFYREAASGKVWFSGTIAGPYRAPRPYTFYTNRRSGTGAYPNNTQRLVEEIVTLADADVDYAQFDVNGDSFVDGLVLVHAGPGAETVIDPNVRANSIWSHKWTTNRELTHDNTHIYAYLTVPEESNIGVWAHELGHLIFGWPDLYDIDNSSEGLGDFCLMAGGSWNALGRRPAHPSAWCKQHHGWVQVHTLTGNKRVVIPPVETDPQVYKLWTRGQPAEEYFLLENRQRIGFDDNLPDTGLAIYHVDETQEDNSQESHYLVGLKQADGRNDLENARNRGDNTDLWPLDDKHTFDANSTPNSNAHNGALTFVSVANIALEGGQPTGPHNITADITVDNVLPDDNGDNGKTVPETTGCLEALTALIRALFRSGSGS
mgnify:CR=1 FL=1